MIIPIGILKFRLKVDYKNIYLYSTWCAGRMVLQLYFYLKSHILCKMNAQILAYNDNQIPPFTQICDLLASSIHGALSESDDKIWYAMPVWMIDGNPVVGYSKLKDCIRLLFWSGQTFEEEKLKGFGKFKSAEIRYTSIEQIDLIDLERWLIKAREIQWDYKNIVKRKGGLERLK